jgi:hypothetical protein
MAHNQALTLVALAKQEATTSVQQSYGMKLFCIENSLLLVLLTALASSVSVQVGSYEAIEDICHHPGLLHAASFALNHFCRGVLVQAIPQENTKYNPPTSIRFPCVWACEWQNALLV